MEKEYVYNNKVCKRTVKGLFVHNRDAVKAEIKELSDDEIFNYKCAILINTIKGKLSAKAITVSDSCVYRYIREEKAARLEKMVNEEEEQKTPEKTNEQI